jgi:hypothetical protein
MRQRCWSRVAASCIFWIAATGYAHAVALSDPPWLLQTWGRPEPVAEAKPSAECAGGASQAWAGFLFSKTRSGGGAAELIIPAVLSPGKAYELQLPVKLLRGDGGMDVFFRRDSPYYETSAIKTVVPKPQWQMVVLRGVFDAPKQGSVRIALRQDGTAVCLGQPQLREINPDVVGADDNWHPLPAHFFGIHLNQLGRHNGWPSFQPDVVRMWDTGTTWHDMQPHEGRIDWRTNAYAQRLEYFSGHVRRYSRDAALLMTLGMTPTWASAAGDNGACATSGYGERTCVPPADVEPWRRYVAEVAKRFDGGRISIWEIWNEADIPMHWLGTPQQMVELVRIAAEETKKADPRSVIIGPNVTASGLYFLNNFLAAGGGKYIDGISIHAYLGFGSGQALSRLRNVREILRSHGLNLPIWNTESSTACGGDPDPATQMLCEKTHDETVLQSALLHAAMGMANFTYYTWEGLHAEVGGVGMVQADFRTNTRLGGLYEDLARWMRGASLRPLPSGPGPVTRVQWRKDGRQCVVAWTSGAAVKVSPGVFDQANFVHDVSGRPAERDPTGAWLLGPMPMIGCASVALAPRH